MIQLFKKKLTTSEQLLIDLVQKKEPTFSDFYKIGRHTNIILSFKGTALDLGLDGGVYTLNHAVLGRSFGKQLYKTFYQKHFERMKKLTDKAVMYAVEVVAKGDEK